MRISTNTLFDSGVSRITELQNSLLKTQQQIASGKRILTPADDPVAAAHALEVTQGQSVNTQYASNRQSARDSLATEEGVLQSVTSLIQDVKTLTVQAGGVLDDPQRKFLSAELKGRFDELLGLANSRDGMGNFIFGGYQTTAQPFSQVSGAVQYNGDQGQRMLQVGATRQMALSDAGDTVFANIRNGNGTFVTAAGTNASTSLANSGTGIISSGSVVDSTQLTGDNYTITFSVTGGVTTYDILDTTTGDPVAPGGFPYASGQSITGIPGLQFNVTGDPSDQDTFTVQPSANQSIFSTLSNLINALNTPAVDATGKAHLTNELNSANQSLDNSLDNILTVRASIGARLKEIDSLNSEGEDRNLQYSQTLADLQNVDYAQAISQLTQQQTTLQAAQQSFVKLTSLSVFNYL